MTARGTTAGRASTGAWGSCGPAPGLSDLPFSSESAEGPGVGLCFMGLSGFCALLRGILVVPHGSC